MKPRIAIPVPTSTDTEYNRLNWQSYADCVAAADAEPVRLDLTLSERELREKASTCHGSLLPGSPADVLPSSYGHEAADASAPADAAREAQDRYLLEESYATRKPILCVCFGLQMLNTFRGGTLIQDVSILPVNHSAGRAVAVAHAVQVAPGSLLSSLLGPEEALEVSGFRRLAVNSSHHQAVAIVGADLRISARCPQDGVVEALEGVRCEEESSRHFVFGVQWHPERTTHVSVTSQNIFLRLRSEAAVWRGKQA